MKTASTTSENYNAAPRFKFNQKTRSTEDSASLKAWEEENAEYATWNLIEDEQETTNC
jgi:hypothetical protein